MADEKVSFLLDLDVKEFTEKGLHAKGIIEKIGSEENLTGLIEGLTKAGTLLGTAGIAAFAFKKAIDLTLEGEEIERVNKQFEILSTQAGIGPKELKEGLEKAAGGLVDTTDALKIANEAITKMGGSARELPQIMEIARKSVSVYGGDAKTNFQAISEAIANGNVRALKHYGITIDMAKAERDFAAANGITAGELSEVGKKQAILNAALEAGNSAFKNITENAESATTVLQTLKTTFKDIGETFTLVFEKTIGPGIRSFLGSVQTMATSLKLHIQSSIGEGAEAAAAKLTLTQNKIKSIQDEILKLEKIKGTAMDLAPPITQMRLDSLTTSLAKYKNQLIEVEKQHKVAETSDDVASAKRLANIKKNADASLVDQEKHKKQQILFEKEMEKIDKEYFSSQQKNITTIDQVDALSKKRREMLEAQHNSAIRAIRANTDLTRTQKSQLAIMEDQRYHASLQTNEQTTADFKKKLLDNYVQNSTSASDGIARAFQANSQKMKLEQADFGKRGEEMWNSLSTNSTAALTTMGAQMAQGKDIGTAAADALKGVFLGMLGDRAIAEGSILLLSSIWPPNPLGLAAGSGLLALGGALKSVAGSSGAPSTSGGSPSVQASASGSGPQMQNTMQKEQTQEKLTIASQTGDMAEQAKLKRELLEQERKESEDNILYKKGVSDEEKQALVRQNNDLYNLKKQSLENDLASDKRAKISASGDERTNEAVPNMAAQQKTQRTVAVNIAGNYLETDQTKRMLMDLMRQESDSTGFNYNQIGA